SRRDDVPDADGRAAVRPPTAVAAAPAAHRRTRHRASPEEPRDPTAVERHRDEGAGAAGRRPVQPRVRPPGRSPLGQVGDPRYADAPDRVGPRCRPGAAHGAGCRALRARREATGTRVGALVLALSAPAAHARDTLPLLRRATVAGGQVSQAPA